MTNPPHTDIHLRRRITAATVATVIGLGGILVANAVVDGTGPASAAPPWMEADQLADGTSQARLMGASDDGTLVLDPLEVLSGDEAVRAAVAAGESLEGGSLPNDVYLHDPEDRTFDVATSADATVWLFDCWSTCDLAEVPLADMLANRITYFGGTTPVIEVVVEQGIITHISEVYLP